MADQELLLYVRRASPAQIATSAIVGAVLLAAFVATLPFADRPLSHFHAFMPMVDAVLFIADGITAAILYTQATVLRSRALVMLATGYLFSALIIVPHALSFPGAFAPQGLIGGGPSTTILLVLFWHWGLPLAVIGYAVLRRRAHRAKEQGSLRIAVAASIVVACAAALALTLLATLGHDRLPSLMPDNSQLSTPNVALAALSATVLPAIALGFIWRGPKSLLDIWLMIALGAWMLESVMVLFTSDRFDLGWYSARIAGMLSGVFVLLALLIEISRLYVQLALSARSEQQHREGQLMSLDAAAAAIAHEVKQPITAMVTNASAALIRIEKDPPELPKVVHSLRLIVEDGHRAADTITGIRALFGRGQAAEALVDLNELVREALGLRSVEVASRAITVSLDLSPGLPDLPIRPQQMRQVIVNLLNNAIEALGERPAGPRRIAVRSTTTADGGVAIEISDTGRGVAPDQSQRIFDAFFTTKAYGTGMGLPLCRSIVEGHGGELSLASVVDEGTTFRIVLPGPEAS